ncbi:MAG: DsrE family protein [Myxococcota bacterium]
MADERRPVGAGPVGAGPVRAGPAGEGDGETPSGPFCVVWLYRDAPDAFERAARFALQNSAYGLEVVLLFTDAGARLLQVDRLAQVFRVPGLAALIKKLDEANVRFELDIGAARRAGVVETLGVTIPNLRIADERRVAELTTGARMTARY